MGKQTYWALEGSQAHLGSFLREKFPQAQVFSCGKMGLKLIPSRKHNFCSDSFYCSTIPSSTENGNNLFYKNKQKTTTEMVTTKLINDNIYVCTCLSILFTKLNCSNFSEFS